MHQHSASRRAALACGTDRAEHNGWHCKIEVSRFIDDDGVVATQLEQTLAETRGNALPDVTAHSRRTRERNQCDAPIFDEPRGQLRATVDEHLEDRRQTVRFHDTVADLLNSQRSQRSLR